MQHLARLQLNRRCIFLKVLVVILSFNLYIFRIMDPDDEMRRLHREERCSRSRNTDRARSRSGERRLASVRPGSRSPAEVIRRGGEMNQSLLCRLGTRESGGRGERARESLKGQSRKHHAPDRSQRSRSGELTEQGHNDREFRQQRSRSKSLVLPAGSMALRGRRSPSRNMRSNDRRSRTRTRRSREPACVRDDHERDYDVNDRVNMGSTSRSVARNILRTPDRDDYRFSKADRKRRRSRSLSYSPPTRRGRSNSTNDVLDKFLNILQGVKNQSSSRLSLNNVIPEFDPMAKDQTILTWLTKVEECASIYGWEEKEIIHFALPKLSGVAKSWYQGLDSVLYTWREWKKKLLESFPTRDDYADLLTTMLAKRVRYGDSLEHYYYEKMNLLNRCSIKGRKAVDCLLHGIDDRAVRVGAQAASFREPEEVLKYLKTVKVGTTKDIDRSRLGRSNLVGGTNKPKLETVKRVFKCFNCDTEGHRSFECSKVAQKCVICNKMGHLDIYCRNSKGKNVTKVGEQVQKEEKQIAEVIASDETNEKYVIEVKINGLGLQCFVDLGSQCTLITEQVSTQLGLVLKSDSLPVLRGIGGHSFAPLGQCEVEVVVQGVKQIIDVYIVQNHILKYPVLLGHSFTENPNIFVIKTPNKIIFKRVPESRLFLKVQCRIVIPTQEMRVVAVVTTSNYTGKIYVDGSIRGKSGKEYYLLPGEYAVEAGVSHLLVQNVCDSIVTIDEDVLLTRATPVTTEYDVCSMTFSESTPDDKVICGPEVTTEQKLELQKLLSEFGSCFSTGLGDLGFSTAGEMVIELKDSEPVVYRPYRMSHGERILVQNMVQEMLDAGIVRESSSQYASPIVLVQKKTGEKRLCIDYRALNQRTKKDHYPLPRIEDQLDQLAGSKLFISLDLASGYYQIPISETSRDKTAFVTPDGQFEFTRMPFGLVNAPSVFQRTMNKIMSDAKVKYALIYMDDVLIPASSFEEGLLRLKEVLTLLHKGGLTLKLGKCQFFFNRIDFLGFEVSADGIKPGSRKTEAVAKFPAPKNAHELRQFIGLASFFRRFVKGFANIARPLTDLLRKNSDWKWEKAHEDAFLLLKNLLTERPLLALYDPKRETQVHTDACKNGIGGVLLQKSDEGLFKPVAYYSRKTTPEEQRLHSFELETLAVVASLARFRVYLIGIPFRVLTDCNALRTTMTKRDLVPRIARWWLQLQEYDCEIEYRPGSSMLHADALSRNPVSEANDNVHVLDVLTVGTEDWIATVQSADEDIVRIKTVLSDPKSEDVGDILKNFRLKSGKVFRVTGSESSDLRWVVPKGVRWQIVKMNHDDLGHFGFEKTLTRIQQSFWFPKMRRFVKKYVRSCLECAYHKGTTGKQEGELHPIPKSELPFQTVHADHLGPFVRSTKGNTYLLVVVDGTSKFVNITPVRNTKSSTSIKVLKDHISYFGAPARLITDRGTSFTSHSFEVFIKSLGIRHILNAVATPRANGQVERFNRSILEALSSKCSDKNDKNWDDHIWSIQLGLNTTVHKATGKSPVELLFGFRVNSGTENLLSDVIAETVDKTTPEQLDKIRTDAEQRVRSQQAKDKERFDAKRKASHVYSEGDLVSIRREVPGDGKSMKLAAKYQGPYRIKKILPNERYVVEDTPLTKKKNHRTYDNVVAVDKLKPWLCFDKNFGSSSESETDNRHDDEL